MIYVVEYRTRKNGWTLAQEFTSLDKAVQVRDDAMKYEMKGTKDWRVRPK